MNSTKILTNNGKRIDAITYFGDVNELMVGLLINFTLQAKVAGSSEIHLHISSGGGSLHAGFAAYHHLRSLNIPIITHNIGNVESSAILLFLAADVRRASPHSTFLLHDFHWGYPAGQVRAGVLREHLQTLDFDSNRYAEIFDERTQKGFDIRSCLSVRAERVNASSAANIGITTEPATDPTFPTDAVLWWITPTP